MAEIGEALGRLSALADSAKVLRLRRINRIRTIQGSLAIEGNTLSEAQITTILDGKRVLAPPREIREVRNAAVVYDRLAQWQPGSEKELVEAPSILLSIGKPADGSPSRRATDERTERTSNCSPSIAEVLMVSSTRISAWA